MVSGPLIFLLDPDQVTVTHLSFVSKYSYQSLQKSKISANDRGALVIFGILQAKHIAVVVTAKHNLFPVLLDNSCGSLARYWTIPLQIGFGYFIF